MDIQTVSDEIYRRHAREWAALREAIEANERSQAQKSAHDSERTCKSTGRQ